VKRRSGAFYVDTNWLSVSSWAKRTQWDNFCISRKNLTKYRGRPQKHQQKLARNKKFLLKKFGNLEIWKFGNLEIWKFVF
jgi:hypothetical protein